MTNEPDAVDNAIAQVVLDRLEAESLLWDPLEDVVDADDGEVSPLGKRIAIGLSRVLPAMWGLSKIREEFADMADLHALAVVVSHEVCRPARVHKSYGYQTLGLAVGIRHLEAALVDWWEFFCSRNPKEKLPKHVTIPAHKAREIIKLMVTAGEFLKNGELLLVEAYDPQEFVKKKPEPLLSEPNLSRCHDCNEMGDLMLEMEPRHDGARWRLCSKCWQERNEKSNGKT